METYDFIVIGAGMGGLSAANFLARYGKKVLVLEKHLVPGGLVSSFARKGVCFDLGIHGLYELNPGQAIPQFLEYWGADPVETIPCRGGMDCYIGSRKVSIRPGHLTEDFLLAFPEEEDAVRRLLGLMEAINREMFSGTDAPEPPYDMNLLELIRFGMRTKRQRPMFMKYGNKDFRHIASSLPGSDALKAAGFSYAPYPMVFMAFAYQWQVFGRTMYPKGGMQAIPDAAALSLARMGGILKLNTEVTEILTENGRPAGVKTKSGEVYRGKVLSSASPQFTFSWVQGEEMKIRKIRQAMEGKKVFPAVSALFMSVRDRFDFGDLECITIAEPQDFRRDLHAFTEDTAPVVIHIYPGRRMVCTGPSWPYCRWITASGTAGRPARTGAGARLTGR